MTNKIFWRCSLDSLISFFTTCLIYFSFFPPLFARGEKSIYTDGIIEGIKLIFSLSFLSLIFFTPVLLITIFTRILFNNKIYILLSFIFFELYGYLWFVYEPIDFAKNYPSNLNESAIDLHIKYFLHSIPLTITFLLIYVFINKGFVNKKQIC